MRDIDVLKDQDRDLIANTNVLDTFNLRIYESKEKQVFERKVKLLEDRVKRSETDEVVLK